MRRIIYALPIIAFAFFIAMLAYKLVQLRRHNSEYIASVMIGKPAPQFDLPSIYEGKPHFKTADLKGRVTLVHFFGSWCSECRAEHPLLDELAGKGAVLIGIDWKDTPEKAQKWLKGVHNVYDNVVGDSGHTAIDFGLYGVPETYLIDKQGIIRYKQTGQLNMDDIRDKILPMLRQLSQ